MRSSLPSLPLNDGDRAMDLSNRIIMVVEDHELQRRVTLRLLKSLGAGEVLEAANGREALNLMAERGEPADIIICDLDMPEMDGVELISHIAKDQLAQAVVVVSAMEISILNSVETMTKAYDLQMLGAISKPLNLGDLTNCISRFQPKGNINKPYVTHDEFSVEELKLGLAEKEFIAFFQPKVSLATGEVVGVEALVRWFRPGHIVVPPMSFIHQMELEGLVTSLTGVLLTQTCGYLKAWAKRGYTLTASVNVSTHCLDDLNFVDRLYDLVLESECDPKQIILEVIEREVRINAAKVHKVLARLRIKGFGLSMDDFGSGYSTLKGLRNAPFTELKIDQSLVKDSPTQPRDRKILEACLDLARKLNLKTVAEGVETRTEWYLLKSLGCEQAQGYFIARPMPGHKIPDWIQMWQPPEEAKY